MNLDIKRHKLLSIVSERLVEMDLKKKPGQVIGISLEELMTELNCTDSKLRIIASKLFEEGEVELYHVSFKGLLCTEKGLAAYHDKKYLREIEKRIFERIRNWVQVLIPILSLVFSIIIYIATESKLNKGQREIDKLKQELELIRNPYAKNQPVFVDTLRNK
jgi:hypothetical protein